MTLQNKIYDTAIIGGGPAGYTAALYCTRAGLSTVVLEKLAAGGQMCRTMQIDNYPGFEDGIDGYTLGFKMQKGAERFGVETVNTEVLSVNLTGGTKTIKTDIGIVRAKTVIIATGAEHRQLGTEKEAEFTGRGVSYCAACDGMLYKGKTAAVVGGGNSAASDAILLSRVCEKVYLIHRRDTLRADKIYRGLLKNAGNIEFKWNSTVKELLCGETLYGVKIKNVQSGKTEEILCDGLFISVGRSPSSELFRGQLELDEAGYIKADESTRTSIPGVFAAGDVRTKTVRQIVTAAADGAAAAHYAEGYISEREAL